MREPALVPVFYFCRTYKEKGNLHPENYILMRSKHNALPIRFFTSLLPSLLLSVCLLSWSCEETDGFRTIEPESNVLQTVKEQASLSLFNAALERTNVGSTLINQNLSFTLFAPNNEAFGNFLNARGYNGIADVPLEELTSLVNYHVALGRKGLASLDSAMLINTLSNKEIFVYKTAAASNTAILNNEAEIVTADLAARNGIVHIINEVLTPPAQSLAQYIAARAAGENQEFSLLRAALQRAGLLTLLNSNHPFTLLAPTDAAFMNAGYANAEAIEAEDPAVLRNILLYHLLPRYRYSFMFRNGDATTQQGRKVTINTENGTVKGLGNEQPANFISNEQDILTSNGIVHAIDMLLLPQSM